MIIFKRFILFRYNLDPFDKHSDEEVWGALEAANLKVHTIYRSGGLLKLQTLRSTLYVYRSGEPLP